MSWKLCPRCGGKKLSCYESRWTASDFTRRRYECLNRKCKVRFTTAEEIVPGRIGNKNSRGVAIKSLADSTKDRLMKRIDKLLKREMP